MMGVAERMIRVLDAKPRLEEHRRGERVVAAAGRTAERKSSISVSARRPLKLLLVTDRTKGDRTQTPREKTEMITDDKSHITSFVKISAYSVFLCPKKKVEAR